MYTMERSIGPSSNWASSKSGLVRVEADIQVPADHQKTIQSAIGVIDRHNRRSVRMNGSGRLRQEPLFKASGDGLTDDC